MSQEIYSHMILYVADQQRSTDFYAALLTMTPILNVPGMTEFAINRSLVLGLMPETSIRKLLGAKLPDLIERSAPRAELYLRVADAKTYLGRALEQGADLLSDVSYRDWGDNVGYCLDLDGYVIAFAEAHRQDDDVTK